jgi:hypothetical protein
MDDTPQAVRVARRMKGCVTDTHPPRNLRMAQRISSTPVHYPFSFVIVGDSGAWPDPTADAILSALLRQTARLQPAPVFFANLGDFAGPERSRDTTVTSSWSSRFRSRTSASSETHDLDDPAGVDAFARVHGPMNFEFAHRHTRFVAIHAGCPTPLRNLRRGAGTGTFRSGGEQPGVEAFAELARLAALRTGQFIFKENREFCRGLAEQALGNLRVCLNLQASLRRSRRVLKFVPRKVETVQAMLVAVT